MQKERIIRGVNLDWLDLTMGLDFEKILQSGYNIKASALVFRQ